jgi:hypothetical protein
MNNDQVFRTFVVLLTSIILLYGAGMMIAVFVGPESLASKMLSSFAAMFSGLLGLGAGYLLGRK